MHNKTKKNLTWTVLTIINSIPIVFWFLINPLNTHFNNANTILTSLGQIFGLLGLGLFAGHLLVINYDSMDNFITYLTMILIFGGIGFLINYMITKNWNHK
jgi:hypothetical protein